jgi:hypothetical protein
MKHIVLSATLACAGSLSMLADFSYQQTTTMTGGVMMRFAGALARPTESTVLVKGHRMAHVNARTAQMIDVDKETITHVDFDKKTWSLMTFAQMKQMMEDMMNRMQSRQGNQTDVQFKAAVKDTGQTKTIAGLTAKELVLTLTMEGADQKTGNSGSMDIQNDMWLAPVPGYDEVRNLQKLMAAKLGVMPGQNPAMFAQRPEMMKGMAELYKEMAKVDGVPVQTITRMGGIGAGTDTAGGNNPSTNQQQQAPSGLGRLGLPGLGGFGRGRKKNDQQDSTTQQPTNNGSQTGGGVLMEMTTESNNFSSAQVDESKFEVPSGFKQVDPQLGRGGR